VLRRYNNRTYRIDDIDWHKSPRSKFTKKTGEQISYIDYYRNTYSRNMITELEQVTVTISSSSFLFVIL
jgi:aubergine-like protein